VDFATFQDLFRIARDEVLARSAKITRDAVEREGSDANVLVAAACAVGDEVIGQIVDVESGLFLDSAAGQALDRLVFDRYGIARKAAAPAVGLVTFSLPTPAVSAFAIPAGTVLQTSSGIQFITTTSSAVFGVGDTTLDVNVRSALAGASQQAGAATITNILTAISGAPVGLTVTNTNATAGADDAEPDDALRTRARQFFVNARRGTVGAIEAGALAVPGVRSATAFEALDTLGRPAKSVELVVTDAFTSALVQAGVDPPAYQTQAQTLAENVFAGLVDSRAAGIYVAVTVAQVVLQPVRLALTFTAGADTNPVSAQAVAAIVNYVNALKPGAAFVAAAANAALQSVPNLVFTGDEVISPPGNVQPGILQVLRTSTSLVTVIP
jgi:hypothetical protein